MSAAAQPAPIRTTCSERRTAAPRVEMAFERKTRIYAAASSAQCSLAVASLLPLMQAWKRGFVTQRCIEMVVGRLATDDQFRETFLSDPHRALGELLERGMHLTHVEIAALIATDAALWKRVADHLDSRLQKIDPP